MLALIALEQREYDEAERIATTLGEVYEKLGDRRQQAQAIIAARNQIVEGAVGMVQMALQRLSEEDIVELDEERKAAMVNNLLVVLTSEHESQPILNTGSLY